MLSVAGLARSRKGLGALVSVPRGPQRDGSEEVDGRTQRPPTWHPSPQGSHLSVLGNGKNEDFGARPNLIWIRILPFIYCVNMGMFFKSMGLRFFTSETLSRRW